MIDQTNDLGNAISYPTNVGETDVRHLEQNHTTFLMVDSGRDDISSSIDAAIKFRIKFEVRYPMHFIISTITIFDTLNSDLNL